MITTTEVEVTNGDGIRMVNAQLRYYMHVSDPDSIDDTEWAMLVKELEWIRREEAKRK